MSWISRESERPDIVITSSDLGICGRSRQMVLTVLIWLPRIWDIGALRFDAFDFVHNLM